MKKLEHFNKQTAEALTLPLEVVQAVNQYYWKYGVKRNLSEARYRSIYIRNMGTINISRYKLYKEIRKCIEKIRRMQQSKWHREVTKNKSIEDYKVMLSTLLKRRSEMARDILLVRPNKVTIRPLTLRDYRQTEE